MPNETTNDNIPRGLKLRHTLRGHEEAINRIAWSPDGRTLASGANDFTIRLWNTETGTLLQTLIKFRGWVTSIAWAPDGQTLASGSTDGFIQLWDTKTWNMRQGARHQAAAAWSMA